MTLVTRTFFPALLLLAAAGQAGEVLYNGIELPDQWPPKMTHLPERLPTPPYLIDPPNVIPIDVGRQLFVDDFLIERTDMTRRFHRPVYHAANPVLTFDKEWEMSEQQGGLPTACPYSGGVWYDPARKKFLMWYMGGYIEHLCLAESDDGVRWIKTNHDVVPGTNIVLRRGATESNSLLMDLEDPDPQRRFKYFLTNIGRGWKTEYRTSADGVHWSVPRWLSGPHGDRTTVFYNPFRRRWVFALRTSDRSGLRQGRAKKYWETADINDAASVQWPASQTGQFEADAPLWVSADRGLDKPRIEVGISPQLYHLDCVAYESLMLGMFSILRGDFHENDSEGRDAYPGRPKCAEVCMGYTRDGFNWHRPTHDTFAGISERRGDWNWGNVQSAGNSFVVVGDHLYFYVSGRKGAGDFKDQNTALFNAAYAGCSTGLAVLRRDGFASMAADDTERTLTTRKLKFSGSRLFVNVDAPDGELRVEILDKQRTVIAPFSKSECVPLQTNRTLQRVNWKNDPDLSELSGREIRFRFYLKNGDLYSFWVSPDESGASNGFVAGGGPGFTSNRDTVGSGSYTALNPPLLATRRTQAALPTKTQDNLDQVPRQDMVMWLRADAIENVTSGASVAHWKDVSGNGLDGMQDEQARQPIWVKDGINGAASIRFDGQDDHLKLDHYPGLFLPYYQSTIFAVVRPAEGGGGTILSQAHANLSVLPNQGGILSYGSSFPSVDGEQLWPQIQTTTSDLMPLGRGAICALRRTGDGQGETALFVNGVRNCQGTAFPYHITSPIGAYVGCAYRERSPWKGDIAEIIIYARALSDEERRNVEKYLSTKYRIATER